MKPQRKNQFSVVFWIVGLLVCLVAQGRVIADVQTLKGLRLLGTRVIYPAQETRGITFSVTNNALEPFLIQSRVTPWQESPQYMATTEVVPFIVTPPLARLDAGETLNLRIRETQKIFPIDRESVFGFHLKGIPSQAELPVPGSSATTHSEPSVQMVLALQYTLKLFYRPATLPVYNAEQITKSLQFTREGTRLVVTNPTAFYVTFDSLTLAGKPIDGDALFEMVPPFGQQTYPLPTSVVQGVLTWRIVTDLGDRTDLQTRALTTLESLSSLFTPSTQKQSGE